MHVALEVANVLCPRGGHVRAFGPSVPLDETRAARTEVINVEEHNDPRKEELQVPLDDRALILSGLFRAGRERV